MTDPYDEFEAEIVTLLNASVKEAFIAGHRIGNTEYEDDAIEAYNEWAKDNE